MVTCAYFYPQSTSCETRAIRAKALGFPIIDETQLVQSATPLFVGHRQPRVYSYNGTSTRWDDARSETMNSQIHIAKAFGIDAFIFVSYCGVQDTHIMRELSHPIEKAFLRSPNCDMIRFGLMFSLSRPRVALPVSPGFREPNRHYEISTLTAQAICDTCASKYWFRPNYLSIKGRPYLSLFFGDAVSDSNKYANLAKFLHYIRMYSVSRYNLKPYIVAVVRSLREGLKYMQMNFDAITGYAFLPDYDRRAPPIQDYMSLVVQREKEWQVLTEKAPVPFIPPAVIGWDASPTGQRGHNLLEVSGIYPFTPIVVNSGPAMFAEMVRKVNHFVNRNVPFDERLLLVCAWNEIRQGNALIPELSYDDSWGYLNSLRDCVRRE